jgi:hypothetical protein
MDPVAAASFISALMILAPLDRAQFMNGMARAAGDFEVIAPKITLKRMPFWEYPHLASSK